MIKTISDLLRALVVAEAAKIDRLGIKHGPTIGAMYEGLGRSFLEQSLPVGGELRVVHGFVRGLDGVLSRQTDCMVVMAEGEELPHGGGHVWPVANVLMTIEFKKRLFKAELNDGIDKSEDLRRVATSWMDQRFEDNQPAPRVLSAFAMMTGVHPDRIAALESLPVSDRVMLRVLLEEHIAPVRVIFGYEGYATEASLRTAFADMLEDRIDNGAPLSPAAIPQLIVAGNSSLLKLNGFPYGTPLDDDKWELLVSSSENPIRLLIELLWARVTTRLNIRAVMDDTLELEELHKFLSARFVEEGGSPRGWLYGIRDVPQQALASARSVEWSPAKLANDEFVLLMMMNNRGGRISLSDEALSSKDYSHCFASLVEKRLIGWDDRKQREANVLYDAVGFFFTPDGQAWAACANDDRTVLWLTQSIERHERLRQATKS